MPLTKLVFKPGVTREITSYSNEGAWYETEKVRFRFGFPEKLGGWTKDSGTTSSTLAPTSGSFWGVCRSLWNWLNLAGYNLLGLGTNLKFYIQSGNGGIFYDVTPIRLTTAAGAVTFTATNGSTTLLVNCVNHGAITGDFVTFSGAVGLGGNITAAVLNQEYQIKSIVSSNSFTITTSVAANSSDVGNGGASTVGAFQINVGSAVYGSVVGWGAGAWGGLNPPYASTGWGQSVGYTNIRLWSQANFGENLIFCPRGGAMNFWAVNNNPTIFDRGQVIVAGGSITQKNYATGVGTTSVSIDATCPSQVNAVMVSDSTRFVIALGANDPTGVVSTVNIDPLMVRWSDQESYSVWTPAVTNQAGSYRLSQGSQIITGIQTRQEILVFTDSALYSMQYIGAPYVWSFQAMSSNITVISPNAVATASNVTYWMGIDKFYIYTGKVDTLPCALRRDIFDNFNAQQAAQVFAGVNEGFNEIWWFYPSANSSYPDKYVIYNYVEGTWYNGNLSRTAWLGTRLRTYPMATNYNTAYTSGNLIYHENGVDDGSVTPAQPITSYIQSADFDIGDGDHFSYVWRVVPDVTFDGSNSAAPSVNMTIRPRQNPGTDYGNTDNPSVVSGNNYTNQNTYNVQKFTQYAYIRVRGRQMALKVGSNTLGTQWQLGSPRLDVKSDGKR
jgi:hypothetical protein